MASFSLLQGGIPTARQQLQQPCVSLSRSRSACHTTTSFSSPSGKPAGLRTVQLNSPKVHGWNLRGLSTRGKRTIVYVTPETAESPAPPVTDKTWEEAVLKSNVPVLVDFWAPWCGPCRMIGPIVDEIAEEYGPKLKAFKLNTDESPGIATEFGIRSIPTVMIFKDGTKMETIIGAVPKQTLTQSIEKYVD